MNSPGQYALYDGREFMGSFTEREDGVLARGRDYKPIGRFANRKAALAAIVERYIAPSDREADL